MPDPRYRVKLYGHTSEDSEDFCRELADLLGIAEKDALDMLDRVPVVVKTGLERLEVERFTDMLLSIRALFLVEPETGEESPVELPSQPAVQPQALPEIRPQPQDDSARSNLWLCLMAAAGGFLVIFCIVAYISSYSNLYREPVREAQPSDRKLLPQQGPVSGAAASMVPLLEERIDTLAEEMNDLAASQRMLEKDIAATYGRADTDPLAMRAKQQELQTIRAKIASMNRELFELKQELKTIIEQTSGRPEAGSP